MITGKHLIIDIFNISSNEQIKYVNDITNIMDKIVIKFNLNVVNKAIHQFTPYGVTGVYVLSESHLSIHTYVDEKKIALDLYTCNPDNITNDAAEYIKNLFDINAEYTYKIISR